VSLALSQPVGLLDHPAEDGFGREHFGFADGLSQPAIADPQAGPTKRPGQGTHKRLRREALVSPGEFILGYRDEEGELAALPENPLRRNGSFMVLRKLEQDVAAFTTYLAGYAEAHGVEEELLAAKLIGRWRDGTPLATSPDSDSSALSAAERFKLSNDFRYGKDADGIACPVGAHVRRAHPRDAMGWQGRLTKRHRIIRRGMPYGARWTEATDPADTDRGLMFICFQASIERQFEVIQGRWLNDGDAFGLGGERDLLVANDESGRITLQGDPPRFLAGLPSFVTTRGGGYFFAPGIGALKALGERKRPAVRS
jgi:Dyp-type peroxidase family